MSGENVSLRDRGYLVVGEGTRCALPHRDLELWRSENGQTLVSPLPLGLVLSDHEARRLDARFLASLQAAKIPVATNVADQDVSALAAGWSLAVLGEMTALLASTRSALAEIRVLHEATQDNFLQAEAWLGEMLSPKFSQIRKFARASGRIRLKPGERLLQALPCSSRGLAAIDVALGATEVSHTQDLRARLLRWNDEVIAELAVPTLPTSPNWVRLSLPRAMAGPDEDCTLELQCHGGGMDVCLASPVPFDRLRARTDNDVHASPLALVIWGGLPDVALPNIGLVQATTVSVQVLYQTAAELPAPIALVGGATQNRKQGTYEIRPDLQGTALMVIPDVSLVGFQEVEAFVQLFGEAGATVTFSVTARGVIQSAHDAYRLATGSYLDPTQFVRLADKTSAPQVDFVLRLENAHPGAALRLWALKLSCKAG